MVKKKKVLHIVEAFGGGVFTFMVDLLNATSQYYNITLACSIRNQTPADYKKYLNDDIKIVELKNGSRSINLKSDLKLFKEIKNLVDDEQPDIVHLHSSKAGFIGRLILSDKKYKILYNPHGFAFLQKDSNKIKRFIYKTFEYIASKKGGIIVGVSKGEYDEALKLTSRAYLINNGIDINKLPKFEEKNCNKNNIKICTVGRMCYQKNPELFNEIAENFPNIEFTWIGEGELEHMLTAKNINKTGWMKKDDVLNLVNKSDIFILTSLWEGLPIALLEAMYYKKICIVSNSIGNRDVINGKNGFIANNLDDYVNVINSIISSNEDINEIRENAYLDVINKYNMDNTSKKYMELYDYEDMILEKNISLNTKKEGI